MPFATSHTHTQKTPKNRLHIETYDHINMEPLSQHHRTNSLQQNVWNTCLKISIHTCTTYSFVGCTRRDTHTNPTQRERERDLERHTHTDTHVHTHTHTNTHTNTHTHKHTHTHTHAQLQAGFWGLGLLWAFRPRLRINLQWLEVCL